MASGSLWNDALVMMDKETESLWSQINGQCISGAMEGSKLTLFKSSHTTFVAFKEKYPDGQLLKKPDKGSAGSHYEKYFRSDDKYGIFGNSYQFDRIGQKDLVYGVRMDGKEYAVTKKYLMKHGSARFPIELDVVEFIYDAATETVSAVRKLNLVISYVNPDDSLETWGTTPTPLPVITSYWFAWVNFFSDTELIYLEKTDSE